MKGCITVMLSFVLMREVWGIYFTPDAEAILLP